MKISGADSDFHRRDLWEAIEAGAYPEYEMGVLIFPEEQAEGFTFDVLDPTKIVPEELVCSSGPVPFDDFRYIRALRCQAIFSPSADHTGTRRLRDRT